MPYSHNGGSLGSITTRDFIDYIGLCESDRIGYIMIWHVICKSLYMYTDEDTGIMETD